MADAYLGGAGNVDCRLLIASAARLLIAKQDEQPPLSMQKRV